MSLNTNLQLCIWIYVFDQLLCLHIMHYRIVKFHLYIYRYFTLYIGI